WEHTQIAEGVALVEAALRRSRALGGPGPYQLQAAIAAVHAEAPSADATDWHQIELLYDELMRLLPPPAAALDRGGAVAMARGPAAGLDVLDGLAGEDVLQQLHLYHSARADLLGRVGRRDEGAAAYRRALELATTAAERRFIARRLDDYASPANTSYPSREASSANSHRGRRRARSARMGSPSVAVRKPGSPSSGCESPTRRGPTRGAS